MVIGDDNVIIDYDDGTEADRAKIRSALEKVLNDKPDRRYIWVWLDGPPTDIEVKAARMSDEEAKVSDPPWPLIGPIVTSGLAAHIGQDCTGWVKGVLRKLGMHPKGE